VRSEPVVSEQGRRITVDPCRGTAVTTWSTAPMTCPSLEIYFRLPLMTRPDVA